MPKRQKRNKQKDASELAGNMPVDGTQTDGNVGGITLRTMSRAGKFMWLAIAFLIVTILMFLGYVFLYNSSIVNEERSCWVQQQNIEALCQKYITENGFSSAPAYIEDIPGFQNVAHDCPSGGSYTWNPITQQYSCSEHGHWPDGFNQAQSVNTGTTTIMIEAE